MPEQWLVDGPRVIDVGSERDRVEKVVVAIIGGTVDVVTHDDSFGARVEVSSVEGLPLRVSWDGRTLKVMHGKDAQTSVLDTLRRLVERVDGQRVEVSLSVPASAHVTLATVSAPIVANAYRTLRRIQHKARLDEQPTQIPQEKIAAEQAAIVALWRAVFSII